MARRVCVGVVLAAAVAAALVGCAAGHGMLTDPRLRGGLNCHRNINPRVIDSHAPVDYCPMCANAGGTGAVRHHGGGHAWTPYKPAQPGGVNRGGFGICGDPAGSSDHRKWGKFGPTKSRPFVREFRAGEVADIEYDATANHGGYLEFYLCDVANNPGQEIRFETFGRDCHYLIREPTASCESGYDRDCGPIDNRFPGRWVLPCRYGPFDQGDQILGGASGKMRYRIPDVHIEVGVFHAYWLTSNACLDPDNFMRDYKYPHAWNGCEGDGGAIGGKPQHHEYCTQHGKFPEEFWNCADVKVTKSGGNNYNHNNYDTYSHNNNNHGNAIGSMNNGKHYSVIEDGNCKHTGNHCASHERCCKESESCTDLGSQGKRCVASGGANGGGQCRQNWEQCNPNDSCCTSGWTCKWQSYHGHHKCSAP